MPNKTYSAGGVVVNKDGDVLVVNQNYNSWSLPKGHIDEGETPLETAKREIEEESGVKDLTLIKEFPTYERYKISSDGKGNDESNLKSIKMFLFKTEDMELNPTDPRNPEARWVSPEKVSEMLTHLKDKEFFQNIISEL